MATSEPEFAAAETLPPAQSTSSLDRDNLRLIKGLGPRAEALLHSFGIYTFGQIAQWDDQAISWMENKLGSRGRIERENWVAQAKELDAARS